ncbi:E3 ubiquitin-protein ligase TRIM71-like [Belonocnema kinseyi]|uniref:E3 ubiquitin-protein ligase TRIM71-like n=1 Tax=Belonocnema kinseyi TaxID=2817044 RepID=UPI00143DFEC7|nr:E3 ubiquitin-protein ligase TRIM71-like [Belonocnema kinseyi]
MNIQTRLFDSKELGMSYENIDSSVDHDYNHNHHNYLPKLSHIFNMDDACTLVKHLRKISVSSSSSLESSVENMPQTQPTFPQMVTPIPIQPIRPETPPTSVCQYHPNIASFYCWLCKQPYCGECGIYTHSGHPATMLHHEIKKATAKSNKMMIDIHTLLTTVNSNIQCVKEAKVSLRSKVQQEKSDLMSEFYLAKRALDDRYQALFEKLNKSTNQRVQRLLKREHTLLSGHRELSELLNNQHRAQKNTLVTRNPLSLLIANDVASRSTLRIERDCWDHMVPYELDNLTFDTSAKSVLDAISDWGRTRCILKPGAIGDKRILRGPPDPNEISPSLLQNPSGRPVHGCLNSVVVWTEQSQSSRGERSPIKLIGGVDKMLADGSTLNRPWGVTCDRNSNILLADRSNHRILVLKEDGTLIRKFGEEGTGPGQFNRPAGITVDAQGRIVVVDKDNNRVQIFTSEGGFLLEFGRKGAAPGRFNCPWDVATNSACEIVISDTRNDRIQLFSPSGQFLRMFGGFKIDKSTWFKSARGVAFRPDGCVVVTDMKTHDIIRVDPDFTTAQSLPVFKEYESLYRPQGVIVDDEGNTIVSDSRNCCIRVFDKNGVFRSQLGTEGVGPDQIDKPYGISLLPDGRVVFVDSGNNRIVIR